MEEWEKPTYPQQWWRTQWLERNGQEMKMGQTTLRSLHSPNTGRVVFRVWEWANVEVTGSDRHVRLLCSQEEGQPRES